MPEEEIIEEQEPTVNENLTVQEPLPIETKGKWQPFEAMTLQTHEVGKTYKIHVNGICEFAISKDRPQAGMRTNDMTYTKNSDTQLWIKTGG